MRFDRRIGMGILILVAIFTSIILFPTSQENTIPVDKSNIINGDTTTSVQVIPLQDSKDIIIQSDIAQVELGKVELKGVAPETREITGGIVSTDDLNIRTAVVSFDVEVESSTITLPKSGPIDAIARCDDFNMETKSCSDWQITSIPFIDHGSYITFTVDHFSAYAGIIVITMAKHLDSDKNLISNIYDEVKAQDNIWSETINDGEYVRITFEEVLDSSKDITLYPRVSCNTTITINGTTIPCEIYEKKIRIDALRSGTK